MENDHAGLNGRMLFDLIGFLIDSAETALQAPSEQAVFRLMEAASRVCEIMVLSGGRYAPLMDDLKELVDEARFYALSDPQRFRNALGRIRSVYKQGHFADSG
jgi:hypothetical protein